MRRSLGAVSIGVVLACGPGKAGSDDAAGEGTFATLETGAPPTTDDLPTGTIDPSTSTSTSTTDTMEATTEVPVTTTSLSEGTTEANTDPTNPPDTDTDTDTGGGEPAKVDFGVLFDTFPAGCVPLGVTLAELLELGVFLDDDGSPWTCALTPGRGNGSGNFDEDDATTDSFPPGIVLDPDTCALGGKINPTLRFGTYAWIVTFTQGDRAAHLPYCAAQTVQAPGSYTISREDGGAGATLVPGTQVLAPGEGVKYGNDVPDPKVTVAGNGACMGGSCFYAFVFAYNTLSWDATVSANPNAKFPAMGFEGFTHAIRIADQDPDLLERFAGRAWVVNMQLDYCIAGNDGDCGNSEPDPAKRAELVRENGDGDYYFSLVLFPG